MGRKYYHFGPPTEMWVIEQSKLPSTTVTPSGNQVINETVAFFCSRRVRELFLSVLRFSPAGLAYKLHLNVLNQVVRPRNIVDGFNAKNQGEICIYGTVWFRKWNLAVGGRMREITWFRKC